MLMNKSLRKVDEEATVLLMTYHIFSARKRKAAAIEKSVPLKHDDKFWQ